MTFSVEHKGGIFYLYGAFFSLFWQTVSIHFPENEKEIGEKDIKKNIYIYIYIYIFLLKGLFIRELFEINFNQTKPNKVTTKIKRHTSFKRTLSSNTWYYPLKKYAPLKVKGDAEGGIIVHHLCPWKALKLQRVHKASLMQTEPAKTQTILYTDCVKPGLMYYPCGIFTCKELNKED